MKNIFIILLLLFSTSIFAQNVFNEAVSGTIAMDGTWKAKYIGKGYKTIIVVNKSAYTLSVAFQKDGKRDTSNAITWIKSGSTPIFSSQICDSMFFKADGDSVQYTVMYGQGVGFNYVGVDNLPSSYNWSQEKLDSLWLILQRVLVTDSMRLYNKTSLMTTLSSVSDTNGMFRTTLDSIDVSGFTSWFNITSYTQDSTIYLSFVRTFPVTGVIPVPLGSYSSLQFDISIASYGYIYYRSQTSKRSINITGK